MTEYINFELKKLKKDDSLLRSYYEFSMDLQRARDPDEPIMDFDNWVERVKFVSSGRYNIYQCIASKESGQIQGIVKRRF